MRKTIFISVVAFAVAFVSFGDSFIVQAQDGGLEGIQIRPSLFEFRAQPGQSLEFIINVKNEGDAAQTFYPRVRDIESMDERGKPVWTDLTLEKTGAELSSWTTFSISALRLEPDETGEMSVFVNVPQNAPNGGVFGMVGLERTPPGIEELGGSSGLGIGFTTGALVALAIGDDIVDDAALLSFTADPRVGSGPGVTFGTRLENMGNALIRPIGTIEVTNMFGKFTSSASFNPGGAAMLPNTTRGYETSWEGEGFLIGRYTADIFISYGTAAKKTLVGTTSFWILPARTLLIGLGVLLIAFLIIFAWVRSYVRRRLRAAGHDGVSRGISGPSSFIAILVSALIIAALALAFAFLFLA